MAFNKWDFYPGALTKPVRPEVCHRHYAPEFLLTRKYFGRSHCNHSPHLEFHMVEAFTPEIVLDWNSADREKQFTSPTVMGFRMLLGLLCAEGSRLLKCEEMSQNSHSSHTGIILTFCVLGIISDAKKTAPCFWRKTHLCKMPWLGRHK